MPLLANLLARAPRGVVHNDLNGTEAAGHAMKGQAVALRATSGAPALGKAERGHLDDRSGGRLPDALNEVLRVPERGMGG